MSKLVLRKHILGIALEYIDEMRALNYGDNILRGETQSIEHIRKNRQ